MSEIDGKSKAKLGIKLVMPGTERMTSFKLNDIFREQCLLLTRSVLAKRKWEE
jgi:hypothetical protein